MRENILKVLRYEKEGLGSYRYRISHSRNLYKPCHDDVVKAAESLQSFTLAVPEACIVLSESTDIRQVLILLHDLDKFFF